MTNEKQSPPLWQIMRQNFPLKQFIVGALVPIALFYLFHRLGKPLTGALLASGWGIGVASITYIFFKNTNLFAALSVPFSLIELIGIIVTLSPNFYLAWPAIDKTLWGLIYLGSVLLSRPLILILAQAMGMFPKSKEIGEFSNSDLFRSAWTILTIIWGIVHLIVSALLISSQIWLPLEVFLMIRTFSGAPLLAVLLTFSFWFPGWFWNRSSVSVSQK